MYMHPKTYLWIQEQDRERMFQQRALERAARSGGEQRPGIVRGGLASIVKFVRNAAAAASRRADPVEPDLAADRRFERLTQDRRRPSYWGRRGDDRALSCEGMARRLSSPIFVGRSEELQTLLSTADSAADGQPSLVLVGGEAGVGKSRLVEEAVAPAARPTTGWSSRAARSPSATTGSRSARSSKPCASLARQVDPDRDRRGRRTEPARARPAGPRGVAGRRRGRPAGPDRMAPDPHLRGHPAAARPARRDEPGPARHRGPALGRPFDARPARLPDAQRARRATPDRRRPSGATNCIAAIH